MAFMPKKINDKKVYTTNLTEFIVDEYFLSETSLMSFKEFIL